MISKLIYDLLFFDLKYDFYLSYLLNECGVLGEKVFGLNCL